MTTPAHDERETHHYVLHLPAHAPRKDDPAYGAFEAYRRAHVATAECYVGLRRGLDTCHGGLELHHAHLEFATVNGVDLHALMVDYPEVETEEELLAWAESDANFRWLCVKHHRSSEAGAHALAHADWEASLYVRGLD